MAVAEDPAKQAWLLAEREMVRRAQERAIARPDWAARCHLALLVLSGLALVVVVFGDYGSTAALGAMAWAAGVGWAGIPGPPSRLRLACAVVAASSFVGGAISGLV